jgi:hypothetical protein
VETESAPSHFDTRLGRPLHSTFSVVLFFFDRDNDHEEIYTEGRDGDMVDNFGSTGVNAKV